SKLCNLWFTYELVRRLERAGLAPPTGPTVNGFDPGLVPGSGLARDYPAPLRFIWDRVGPTLARGLTPLTPTINPPPNSPPADPPGPQTRPRPAASGAAPQPGARSRKVLPTPPALASRPTPRPLLRQAPSPPPLGRKPHPSPNHPRGIPHLTLITEHPGPTRS